MTVLTKEKILKEIKKGRIRIDCSSCLYIGPGSIDFTLGDIVRIFKKNITLIQAAEDLDYQKITKIIKITKNKPFILHPAQTILASTKEKLTLPSNLCGWIEGRSRFARLGMGVHVSAGFIQPGTANHPVLEITNLGSIPISLVPGIKICQVILERCDGLAIYQGKFKHQSQP